MSHFIRTEADLDTAIAALIKADRRFEPAFALAGRPPLRKRADGFAGLASIVVSQQLSTASARAIWARLEAAFDPLELRLAVGWRPPTLDAGVLLLDTDLLTTVLYSEWYYGTVPDTVRQAAAARRYDLYLLLDVDVPWVPSTHEHREDTTFIHIDVDAAKKDLPIWNFPGDIRVQGDAETVFFDI